MFHDVGWEAVCNMYNKLMAVAVNVCMCVKHNSTDRLNSYFYVKCILCVQIYF